MKLINVDFGWYKITNLGCSEKDKNRLALAGIKKGEKVFVIKKNSSGAVLSVYSGEVGVCKEICEKVWVEKCKEY